MPHRGLSEWPSMGLFRKQEKVSAPSPSVESGIAPTDRRIAACPYCGVALKKVPGAKTKCPECGEYMYVRTDPGINARVVVTKEEADTIDLEWEVLNGRGDEAIRKMLHSKAVRANLPSQFSDADVQWRVLNDDLLMYAKSGDMYSYQQTRFAQAEHLREEGNLGQALDFYLDAAYLNINGPQSEPSTKWLPETYFAPQGIAIDYVRSLCERLNISYDKALTEHVRLATASEKSLKLPVKWADAKAIILDALRTNV
jgi:predicted RNA-binding Zn-ribbon protein involved in translation (DUF1610 family)